MKNFYNNYKHAIPLLLFGILYLSWFSHLEKTVVRGYHVIHMTIDNYIPFIEVFVIPYFLWFLYVSAVVLILFFKGKDDYYKTCVFLFTGMTIFLIVSTIYPNGHHLRPAVMPRDNIFTQMIAGLYKTDTSTNLFPSIHVYNSIGAHLAIMHSEYFAKKRTVKIGSFLLCISIILSTVLIKQHSVFDMLTAFGLSAVMYVLVYRRDMIPLFGANKRKPKPRPTGLL